MGQTFACKIDANAADTNTTNQPYNESPVTSWRKFRKRNIVLTFYTIPQVWKHKELFDIKEMLLFFASGFYAIFAIFQGQMLERKLECLKILKNLA